MSLALTTDPRLKRLTEICSTLPEVVQVIHDDFADFRVRKKVFAYFFDDHDSDGIVSICVRSELRENVELATAAPDLYYLPPYIGSRGWFGIRVDVGSIDWKDVDGAVQHSYRLAAPKTLLKRLSEKT